VIITVRFHPGKFCVFVAPVLRQEAHLMLTNPRDAFRGQSRSPNIIPFHMLGIISSCAIVTLSSRHAVFPIVDFKNAVTLKTGLGVDVLS